MKKNLTTTIIAGIHKHKSINLPDIQTTRSSKNILRESVFNTLQFEIYDSELVEVFGGSGSIGLEALSRGANKVVFIERDKNSYNTLRGNIKLLKEEARSIAINGDSFAVIGEAMGYVSNAIVYIDPPFAIREGHEDIYDKCISMIQNLPKEKVKMVIVEHMTSLDLPQHIGDLTLHKTKKFGKSSLTYYKYI